MQPLTIILLVLIGVLAIIGGYKGFKRGIGRQIVRVLTVAVSLFIALYLTKLFMGAATVWIGNSSAEALVKLVEFLNLPLGEYEGVLDYLDANTLNYVLAIPLALAIAPILFVVCFLLLKLVMLIPHALISGIAGFSDKRNNGLTRFLGMLLGLIQGVVVAAIIISPLAGALTASREVIETMQKEQPDTEDTTRITAFYDDVLKPYAEEPIITAVGAVGGRVLYGNIATVTIKDVEYDMVETVGEPTVKLGVGINKLWGWDWKKPTPENEEAVLAMIEAVDDSDYAKALITDVFTFASTAYLDGAIPLQFESPLSEVIHAAFETLGLVNEQSLRQDLDTLAEAYFVLARENIIYALEFSNSEEVREALTRECTNEDGSTTTVVARVVDILNSNEHTTPLVTVLTKLSVAALADEMGADIHLLYDSVKSGLSTTMAIDKDGKTEEEYKAEVSASLDAVMKENGIEIQPEVIDGMSDYIYENYDELKSTDSDGNGELTEKEANDIILSYYDSYIKANGEATPEISE